MKISKERAISALKMVIPKLVDILYIITLFVIVLAFVSTTMYFFYQSDELYAHLNPDVTEQTLDSITDSKIKATNIIEIITKVFGVLSLIKIIMIVFRKENNEVKT